MPVQIVKYECIDCHCMLVNNKMNITKHNLTKKHKNNKQLKKEFFSETLPKMELKERNESYDFVKLIDDMLYNLSNSKIY